MNKKFRTTVLVLAALGIPLGVFQNCSKTAFSGSLEYLQISRGLSVSSYSTPEDVPLNADLVKDRQTLSSRNGLTSTFAAVTEAGQGTLNFADDATFTYSPRENFYGEDSFQYSESQDGQPAVIRTVHIQVIADNDKPTILTDSLNFNMNSSDNLIVLQVADIDDTSATAALSADDKTLQRDTPNGKLEKRNNQLYYTPNPIFRGVEQVELFAVDPRGGVGSKVISFNVGNPFRDLAPAMAVRASGCVTCHANVSSQYITDFGFGNTWFAGTDNKTNLPFGSGNIYGDHGNSWSTAMIAGPIFVPKTAALVSANKLTLEKYISGVEAKKSKPAAVIEKNSIYIGAPTLVVLEQRFKVSASENFKFVPNAADSPALSGLVAAGAGYYTNNGDLNCDGDVFVRGTVFLNKPRVVTKNGCRIYATGPVFLQENPMYVNTGQANAPNNANLQLVSVRAAFLGVGLTHCEDATGWYTKGGHTNPLRMRLKEIWTVASHVTRGAANPSAEGDYILAEAAKISGLKDASCYAGGRDVHIERLLINAPNIQSRLTGNVSGVLIGEVMLFSLSAFSYGFDDVFKRVPVLPLLDPADFLSVQ